MRFLLRLVFLLSGLAATLPAQEVKPRATSPWESSIVMIEVTSKRYDYYQPWTRRTGRAYKTGLVLGDHQILTTADRVYDRTLVRLQKFGRGKWWIGKVTWVDYYANLALLTADDDGFWDDLKPATLRNTMGEDGALQIMRWREGNLEDRKAEFTQFAVRPAQLSSLNHVQLEVASEIQGVGDGEPVVANGHVVGLVTAQSGRDCTAAPASFVQSILDARRQGVYTGLGYFHFFWQTAENLTSLEMLKLDGDPRGVLVSEVSARPDGLPKVLKPHDIILQIDGFDVDIQGDYNDPEFGHLMIENLAARRKWAGDEVKMKIWREGAPLDVTYRLPRFAFTNSLVADAVYDQEPEYLIVGGLIFQPLTDAYLRSWGDDWKRRAPFRLMYYNNQEPTPERPALVLLSQVLPDPYNIGYQEQKWLVVDKVNGQKISYLDQLRDALAKPIDGFHVIEFMPGDNLRKIVLDAGQVEKEATQRVVGRYGIPHEQYLAPREGG